VEIFRFDESSGRPIDLYGSAFLQAPMARIDGHARVSAFHLGPGGLCGRHAAVGNQMLCVVQGEGWVSGDDDLRQPISAGQAAFWIDGEIHTTGTDTGLVAVVIEGPTVHPTAPPA
jgi:quercetin dioxygenase-like cupin family protein